MQIYYLPCLPQAKQSNATEGDIKVIQEALNGLDFLHASILSSLCFITSHF